MKREKRRKKKPRRNTEFKRERREGEGGVVVSSSSLLFLRGFIFLRTINPEFQSLFQRVVEEVPIMSAGPFLVSKIEIRTVHDIL